MRLLMPILLILLGVNVEAGEEAGSRDTDLSRLQGRWTAKAGTRHEIHVLIEIKGRDVHAKIKTPQGLDFQVRGEVKLDETTSPAQPGLEEANRARPAAPARNRRRVQDRRRYLHRLQWRVSGGAAQGIQARRRDPCRRRRVPSSGPQR